MLPNSVRLPNLSYIQHLFSFFSLLSVCFGYSKDAELERKDRVYRQEFAQNKKQELDSLQDFYEQQHNPLEHKAIVENIPKEDQKSYLSKCYHFVCDHYIVSSVILLFLISVLFNPILQFVWIVLHFFKKQLNSWFNALPKSLQRFLHKQRRKFQELWDYIMQSKDGVL